MDTISASVRGGMDAGGVRRNSLHEVVASPYSMRSNHGTWYLGTSVYIPEYRTGCHRGSVASSA